MDEIIDSAVPAMIHELVDEFLRAHIEHHLIRIRPFNLISNSLSQVGLPQAYPSIYNKRVKGIGAWLLRHRLPGTAGHPVTISFNKSFERINVIELRVDLHLLQPWYNKRIFYRIIYD